MHTLRVLLAAPFAAPEIREIPHSLEALQGCVGGDLECWAVDDHVAIYCHEEGRILGLPYNRRLTLDDGTTEAFVGPILFVGDNPDTGESESLTDADIARWTHRLLHPKHPEVRRITRLQRYSARSGRATTVVLRFDTNAHITPVSARTWARSIARNWGIILRETHYPIPGFDGWIGAFHCSGGDGYLVVTAHAPDAWQRFALEGALCCPDTDAFHETTVYAFGEDDDWAILEASLPALAKQAAHHSLQVDAQLPEEISEMHTTAQEILADSARYAEYQTTHQQKIARILATKFPDWVAPLSG